MSAIISAQVTTKIVSKSEIVLRVAGRELNDGNSDAVSLFLDRVDLVQVVLVVPVLVCRPEKGYTFNVPSLLVEAEHKQLVDRNVDPLLVALENAALKAVQGRRRCPHVDGKRSALVVEEPLLDVHRVPRRHLLPADLATC